jgi:hypothetical protein
VRDSHTPSNAPEPHDDDLLRRPRRTQNGVAILPNMRDPAYARHDHHVGRRTMTPTAEQQTVHPTGSCFNDALEFLENGVKLGQINPFDSSWLLVHALCKMDDGHIFAHAVGGTRRRVHYDWNRRRQASRFRRGPARMIMTTTTCRNSRNTRSVKRRLKTASPATSDRGNNATSTGARIKCRLRD